VKTLPCRQALKNNPKKERERERERERGFFFEMGRGKEMEENFEQLQA
jgi:hypothetical protein